MTDEVFRLLALSLPDTTEQPHHGFPSWRVRGRIIATMPEPGTVNVMAGESAIREAVAEHSSWCRERWWGKRLAAVRVDLAAAEPAVLRELVIDTWRLKAPAALVRQHSRLR